jgi:hypothetical protein
LPVQPLTVMPSQLVLLTPTSPPPGSDASVEEIPPPTSPMNYLDQVDQDDGSGDPTSGEEEDPEDAPASTARSGEPPSTEVDPLRPAREPDFIAGPMYTAASGFSKKIVPPGGSAAFYAENSPARVSTPDARSGSALRHHNRDDTAQPSTPPMQTIPQHSRNEDARDSIPPVNTLDDVSAMDISSASSDEEPTAGTAGRLTRSAARKGKEKETGGQRNGSSNSTQVPNTTAASPFSRRKRKKPKTIVKLPGYVSVFDQVHLTCVS